MNVWEEIVILGIDYNDLVIDNAIYSLYEIFDPNNIQMIDYIDLCIGMSLLCKGNLLDKINLIFKILDTNDQGYITKEYIDNYINIILRFLKKFSYNTNTFVYINFTNNMHSLKNLNDKINKNKFIDWHLNNKLFNTNKIKYFTTNYISISSW